MGWLENYPREYYKKYERVPVANDCGWFEVYKLPGDVYAIAEPQQFQEVNFFLIIGSERALLLDTGMGICKIEPLIRELYDGEILTVNCHCHFDHIGNNYLFQPVHVFNHPLALRTAARGLTREQVGAEADADMFQFGYPEGFDPEEYHIPPYTVNHIEDGHIFDLGNRKIRVFHTPGHSEDHIVLYDGKNKILFTGDMVYLGALYTHFDNPVFGHGNIYDYRDSLIRVRDAISPESRLYCSHNDFVTDYAKLCEVIDALQQTIDAETGASDSGSRQEGPIGKGHDYGELANEPHVYQFDGFSIFCKPGLR